MSDRLLAWLDTLSKLLLAGGGLVLFVSLLAALTVGSSESAVPGLENVEREGRGFAALATLAAGLAAAGIMSGLGGILALKVADWRERHE